MRPNPHFHTIILEGGIANDGRFHSIPIKNTSSLTELFRRRVISYFVNKKLLNEKFTRNMLSWKHSGFSVDNSILIPAQDQKARSGLSQYIARHPVSLNKIIYIPEKAKILYKTKYNDYFGENIQLFTATDFIAELTMHIPPKHKHLIRYYGFYSSRSRGKATKDGSLDKFGWGARSEEEPKKEQEENPVETLSEKKPKQTWARLIKKVFEVDPWSLRSKLPSSFGERQNYTVSVLNVVLRWLCWPLLQTLKKYRKYLTTSGRISLHLLIIRTTQKPLNHHFGLLKINLHIHEAEVKD